MRTEERIFVKDLAEYLHVNPRKLMQRANKQDLLRWVHVGIAPRYLAYVTPHGAMRLIAYVRAIQGAAYQTGKLLHDERARVLEQRRRARQRRKLLKAQSV